MINQLNIQLTAPYITFAKSLLVIIATLGIYIMHLKHSTCKLGIYYAHFAGGERERQEIYRITFNRCVAGERNRIRDFFILQPRPRVDLLGSNSYAHFITCNYMKIYFGVKFMELSVIYF